MKSEEKKKFGSDHPSSQSPTFLLGKAKIIIMSYMRSALLPLSSVVRSSVASVRPVGLVGTLYQRSSMIRYASSKASKAAAEQPEIDVKNIGVPMGEC